MINSKKEMVFEYGNRVRCHNYGDGTVVKFSKPCYPGEERREIEKKEGGIKGKVVRSVLLKVRFDFDGAEMSYNRQGYRIGEDGEPDSNATLSKIL